MDTSAEEARLLFEKWAESAAAVRLLLFSSALVIDGVGRVRAFGAALELGGDSWQITVPLEGASFVFSDPREIPLASVRAAESARYELGLAIHLPNGDRFSLRELKSAREEAEPT